MQNPLCVRRGSCPPLMDPTAPPLIDWDGAVLEESRAGRLLALLNTLPRARWAERDPEDNETFLHYAARGENVGAVVALLQSGLVDVNARNTGGNNAAHVAATERRSRVLEVLCAAGVDLRAHTQNGSSALDRAVRLGKVDCARVLVANGMRLSTVRDTCRRHITPKLEAFERGVLRCRAAGVVLLGLKRRRGDVMLALDRWVVRELCFALWSTRTNVQWSL